MKYIACGLFATGSFFICIYHISQWIDILPWRPEFRPEGKYFVSGNSLFLIFGGWIRRSEAVIWAWGCTAPRLACQWPQKDEYAQRTGTHARPNRTSLERFLCLTCPLYRIGKWMAVPALASRRSSCGVAAVEGMLYCVGGNDGTMCLGTSSFEFYWNL